MMSLTPAALLRLTLAEAVLGVFPPFTMARMRRWVRRVCGLRTGRATFFWGAVKLTAPRFSTSRLRIGAHCGFNDGCVLDLAAPITIGNYVAVGHEVRFMTSRRQEDPEIPAPITIGDGVWIGARCTILGGVAIGAGAVIGAGLTVATDVPPDTLLTGAKPVSLARWR